MRTSIPHAAWSSLVLSCSLAAQAPYEWRTLPQQVPPRLATWDSARQTTVLVTTDSGVHQFEWDGQHQRERNHALDGITDLVFLGDDPRRGELVALRSATSTVGRFDGARWTWTSATVRPLLTTQRCIAYDAWRGRLVCLLEGPQGFDANEWDGSAWWTVAGTANGPASRYGGAFAYEPLTRRCVLYGGVLPNGTILGDCWSWDGSQWTLLAANAPPGARSSPCLAAAANGQLVLYGGDASTTTWMLAGATWVQAPTAHDPGPRQGGTLCRDAQGLLLLGGSTTDSAAWHFTGTDWVASGSTFALPRVTTSAPVAAYDQARGQCVLVPGNTSFETWLFDTTWQSTSPAQSPPPRGGASLCWSAVDQGVVLFGGVDPANQEYGDTWLWNGSNWQARTPVHSPPARHLALAIEDPTGGVLLLSGMTTTTLFDDQWRWDGSDWLSMAPTVPPIGPAALGMRRACFDPSRNRIVLTSLMSGASATVVTCEWDGSAWTIANTTPLGNAPYLLGHELSFDPRRGAVVTLGNPTLQWNGATWTSLAPAAQNPPSSITRFLLADLARQRLLLLTSTYQPGLAVGTDTPASTTTFGPGCALGPAPALTALADPVPGAADFALAVGTLTPSAPALLVFGFATQNQPLGNGCVALVANPVVSCFTIATPGAVAEFAVPVPNDPTLRGVTFVAQAAVIDPPRSQLGTVTLTSGLRVTIGD